MQEQTVNSKAVVHYRMKKVRYPTYEELLEKERINQEKNKRDLERIETLLTPTQCKKIL